MSEETNWTEHVTSGEAWFRFLLMILFTPFLGCVGFLILAIALFQFFSVLASGESNPQLRELGSDLSRFAVGIVDFLTYNTEQKPFPFTVSPSAEPADSTASEAPRPTRRTRAARKKPATRRRSTATRKKPVKPAGDPGRETGSKSSSEQTKSEALSDTEGEKHDEQ
ncbi:MAG: DUF4389 domain-containing protein [Gammaproteobacteria bacterium]